MIDLDELLELVPAHLAAQRYYAGEHPPVAVEAVEVEVWREGDPGLIWMIVEAVDADGGRARYQLVLGVRWGTTDHEFLHGKEHEVLGALDGPDGSVVVVYDVVADPELTATMLEHLTGEPVGLVRPLAVEQSNTSIVYDETRIAKLFRRIHDGPNPDVEIVDALQARGSKVAPTQHFVHRRDGRDLLVVRDYLSDAVDGWHLALTSLRDLLADSTQAPEDAGGDFAPEASRLGEVIARLHLDLAESFGAEPPDVGSWIDAFARQAQRVATHIDVDAVTARQRAVAEVDPGVAMRIHGDLHLGQLLRSASGWYVLDFEGEPDRAIGDRHAPSSPLRDLAGMVRSFDYAAAVAVREREVGHPEFGAAASQWRDRAVGAFLDGYEATAGIDVLLPPRPDRRVVLDAFVLDKAVYEIGYELGHRPGWVDIPLSAIDRILR